MKKITLCIVLMGIFSLSAESVSAATPKAPMTQTVTVEKSVPSEASPSTSGLVADNEYQLPFPGILPDHPLYALKQIRDWILDRLVTTPERQIELSILQADKRLAMGILLEEKNKSALAETTISKGEKYLRTAMDTVARMKSETGSVPTPLVEKLNKSSQKHEKVLMQFVSTATGKSLEGYKDSMSVISSIRTELAALTK